ncbi:MAG TPA: hypothetical protein DEH25_01445 [Chloroflexi bacterium]|nr:hypothetical protein [Chloroflexota bacterium]HBY08439.1 hypothetical protein [Chloroflexota bacterium]
MITPSQLIRILLVEDDEYDRFAFFRAVERQGLSYEVTSAETVMAAREILATQTFDIAIVDFNIGPDTAFALFDVLQGMPFIIATGAGDQELAVEAMKKGAYDYLVKDMQGEYLKALDITIQNVLQRYLTEIALRDYHENLEIQVKARTQELTKSNEQLLYEINERKQAEEMIHLQASALAAADNGIMITNIEGKIIWANPAMCQIIGKSVEEMIGQLATGILFYRQKDKLIPDIIQSIKTHKRWANEISNTRPDGIYYTISVSGTPVLNENGEITHLTFILHDITERVKTQQMLEYMVSHDNLTSLPNRLLFQDRANHAIANARRNMSKLAILFLDLDDFKAVNDAFSHSQGDDLLVRISNKLTSCLRENDTAARFGGDEFVVMLENITHPEDIAQVAEKLTYEISRPVTIQGSPYSLSVSIGISIYPNDGSQIDQIIQNADAAMYRAKLRGKNTYQFYTPDMTRDVMERLRIITQIREALTNDTLELYYQPQVDARTGEIIGVEALLRFFTPENISISPAVFIPITEKAGMSHEIGEWVLEKACAQNRMLINQGFNIRLSVNIASRQLNHPELVATISRVLKKSNLDPHMLQLEITENSMFEDIDSAIDVLKQLKKLGIKIAIDDFGTGYSSLGYLTQLELDTIKIDKSFAHNINIDDNRKAVVRGMVAIAQALNVEIVVEGVETKEQLIFFSNLGCHIIQGFYFSPAVPTSILPQLLVNQFQPT